LGCHPDNAWLNSGLGAAIVIVLVLVALGTLVGRRGAGSSAGTRSAG
jgi:hypothetical protein